ncbi:adipose-secreted signaling protein-like [Diadema antillarum]|uniref:adipose-secreted signaling protein-like n=1 Tax=Diadema antillarum TaxID=105358 RepID=UPI003A899FAA
MEVPKTDIDSSMDVESDPAPLPEKMDTEASRLESEEQTSSQTKTRPRSRSKVHFPEDVSDHTEILISREIDSAIDVNLGFLQTDHRYQIRCTVMDTLKGDIIAKENSSSIIQSVEAHQRPDDDGHDIQLELLSHKEGILSEPFTLQSLEEDGRSVKVVLRARLLGKDQGRPMLKEGITNMGPEAEESSEEESDRDTHD